MSTLTQDARVVKYELQVVIDAPRDAVWRALTDETNAWWLQDFHMLGEGSTVRFETHAGGHLIEELEGGGSLLWYTVQMCSPGESIHLVGHVAPEWGGPTTTMLHLALKEDGKSTVLHVTDAQFGFVSDDNVASLREGWTRLFTDGLKRHAEG